MLNVTKDEVELISDADMYLFFEKGIRVGVSYISKRCSKANNEYLKFYDPNEESKYIIYYTQIIYMVTRYQSFFQQVESNGQILRSLT